MFKTTKKSLAYLINFSVDNHRCPLVMSSTLLISSLACAAVANAATADDGDTIVVTASDAESVTAPLQGIVAKASAAGTKSSTPLIKTPQTISVVTRDQMDAQAVSSVSDALSYSSGAFTNYRGSSNRNDEVVARGFRFAPKFLDGLSYGLGSQGSTIGKIDPWLLERVELVHGPASVLYGQVNPGGLVSMTSKRPTAQNIRKVKLSAGNQHLGEAAFDFGGALNEDQSLLYRLNGIASTKHEFVKDYKQERIAIAPALTWLPNPDTSFTLLTSYQNDPEAGFRNFLPAYGTALGTSAGYLPYDLNVSDPNYHQSKREQASIGYIFDHSFNDIFSFQQNFRYSQSDQKYKYLVYTTGGSATDTTISRRQQREETKLDELGVDNQLQAKFATGDVSHTAIGGLDYKWQKNDYNYWRNGGSQYDFDWTNPSYGGSYLVDDSALSLTTSTVKKLDQVGVYLQDQMEWNNWNLLLSGRHDWSEVRTQDRTQNTIEQQNDDKSTGRAALLYAFDNGISPYISYSTSFEPNLDSGAPGSAPFNPTTGAQKEVGVKFQPKGSNTLLTLSLFDITQENITTYNNALGYNEQIGEVRSKGLETEIHSQPIPEISLMAAYTYIDAETTESASTSSPAGKTPAAIPQHSASAWGSYSFLSGALKGFTVGAGVRYIGTSYGDNKESFTVPAYTLYDAMARYDLGEASSRLKGAEVQLNVSNLTDKHYVSSCSGTTACFYGVGRSIIASVSYSW
ncbi:TonB-dependent siderophore receptor [Brenneria populi]|uniref:TonB-dependent siderophore receptor n=1 Tax=Brenneria populi TaxID=1505588 RepID=A0ABU6JQQ7_9GAMM|nr:TonB-dependent siderophore receptor [Brenneria populi Li et al. 2015]